jgi:glycosyltransferase involved in cell wall biosynthesis
MHIIQISFFVDPRGRPGAALLNAWSTLVDVARAARLAGHRVTVVQAAGKPEIISRDGIDYHFVRADDGRLLAESASFRALLAQLRPDLCHVHGLGFPDEVLALRGAVGSTPMLLQDHADRAPRFWKRRRWRRGLAAADGISFCAREQAGLLARATKLPDTTRIFEVPESTCRFVPGDKSAARAATGLYGDPCVLWVGNLIARKDPKTVLMGLKRATRELPGLRLWCCFATAPLRSQVERLIAGDPVLAARVRLLGQMPHDRVETLMQAADLFVLGSRSEGSGYAVIEALATGLPCVVTDIPSFRSLVGEGDDSAGALWPCGDAAQFAEALLRCAAQPALGAAALRRFQSELSAEAVGRKLDAVYRSLAHAVVVSAPADAPQVSIVLPVYNRLRFLRRAVESAMSQTFTDWELIVADDGSDEETRAYLESIERPPRVRVLWLEHSGSPGKTRNAALAVARGHYVAFLDSDDYWAPDKLEMQLPALRHAAGYRWSHSAYEPVDEAGRTIAMRWVPHQGAIFEQILRMEAYIAMPTVLAERSLVMEAGAFDPGQVQHGDYELWLRMILRSDILLVDRPLAYVRNHREHYTRGGAWALHWKLRMVEKLQSRVTDPEHARALRATRASLAACLMRSHARAGAGKEALGVLARSWKYSYWRPTWWASAAVTGVRMLGSSWDKP